MRCSAFDARFTMNSRNYEVLKAEGIKQGPDTYILMEVLSKLLKREIPKQTAPDISRSIKIVGDTPLALLYNVWRLKPFFSVLYNNFHGDCRCRFGIAAVKHFKWSSESKADLLSRVGRCPSGIKCLGGTSSPSTPIGISVLVVPAFVWLPSTECTSRKALEPEESSNGTPSCLDQDSMQRDIVSILHPITHPMLRREQGAENKPLTCI